jgi:hypothetical protein
MNTLANTLTLAKSLDDSPNHTVKKHYHVKKALVPLTINAYNSGEAIIETYKMPEIKSVCKLYGLRVSGTKPVLIKRLLDFFIQTNAAIRIQSNLRRRLVIRWKFLHGPAMRDVSACVNQTDFVSMEALGEIDKRYIYSYTDDKQFTYGFNVLSLIQLLHNDTSPANPYNRNPFTPKELDDIIFLYNASIMLCDELTPDHKLHIRPEYIDRHTFTRAHLRYRNQLDESISRPVEESTYANYFPRVNPISVMPEHSAIRLNRINAIRQRSVENRTMDVFIEIDRLGNYTNQYWFSSLNAYEYATLYRTLYNIWNYQAGLSHDIQTLICPFYNPFDGIFPRAIMHNEVSLLGLKTACLIVFENMVYSGVDDEYRKIGAFHALSALTIVSSGARNALPWLYESII